MIDPSAIPSPAPQTTGGGWHWLPPEPAELQRMLPQFVVESLIGRGGMGAVYRGIQSSLERPVAIKVLPPAIEEQDAAFAERFKNEARLMGRLNHPAIVSVYDFGRTPEGQLYFVMEFVDGTDVQRMIAHEGRMQPEHALAVTAHLCDALGYAHKHGIVHRDIKPSNVLIDSEGRVKVADFGLAKLTTSGGAPGSGLTQTGVAMGTPDYVAPEVFTYGGDVDGRADLYAVGVMLYQMLTGDIPRGMFKMPSQKFQSIDPRFDSIVRRALEHDREERYQTSHELRQDLDIILTTPLAVAGQESSAVLPKPGPAELQRHATPGRTVVKGSRNAVSTLPQYSEAAFEPEATKRRSSSSLPYVIAVVVLLAAGGWVIRQRKAGPPETTAPPAGQAAPAIEAQLATLEAQFQSALQHEAAASSHAEQTAALGASYLTALDRGLQEATKNGRLDEALALREEKERFTTQQAVPPADPARLDGAVARLRDTYRKTAKTYEQQKDAAALPLYDRYLEQLASLETELTARSQNAAAAKVRMKREEMQAERAQRAAKVPASTLPLPPPATDAPQRPPCAGAQWPHGHSLYA